MDDDYNPFKGLEAYEPHIEWVDEISLWIVHADKLPVTLTSSDETFAGAVRKFKTLLEDYKQGIINAQKLRDSFSKGSL